jgi:uncharacterized membrane protein
MDRVQPQTDINRPASFVLNWGFRISAVLMVLGLVLSLAQDDGLHSKLEGVATIFEDIGDGDGAGFVGLSILVMIASPIVSAMAIMVSLARTGDRRYAAITAAVLVILVVSATISAL